MRPRIINTRPDPDPDPDINLSTGPINIRIGTNVDNQLYANFEVGFVFIILSRISTIF